MREAFTSKLRTALDQAQAEARALNQDFVSVEHLLLGLIATEDSEAASGLKLAGVGLKELRERLVGSLVKGAEAPVVTGNLPLSPKAKRAINAALVRAQTANQANVSSRTLLVALLEDTESVARSSLRDAGADLDQLSQILVQDGAIQPED